MRNHQNEIHPTGLETELANAKWKLFEFSESWSNSFESRAGVYVLREEGKICYIGATENIREQMRNLLDTRSHTVRRIIGNQRFIQEDGYERGTAMKNFPLKFEKELNRIFEDNFEVAAFVVEVGRKELEEKLVEKFRPIYNLTWVDKGRATNKAYSLEGKRIAHKNAYRSWDEEEERKVIQMTKEGKSHQAIGDILGRNRGAITSRLKKIKERGNSF